MQVMPKQQNKTTNNMESLMNKKGRSHMNNLISKDT
jgi:hypothetical protein